MNPLKKPAVFNSSKAGAKQGDLMGGSVETVWWGCQMVSWRIDAVLQQYFNEIRNSDIVSSSVNTGGYCTFNIIAHVNLSLSSPIQFLCVLFLIDLFLLIVFVSLQQKGKKRKTNRSKVPFNYKNNPGNICRRSLGIPFCMVKLHKLFISAAGCTFSWETTEL